MGLSPVAILHDLAGNALKSIQEGSDYFLGAIAKLRNAAGTIINPATEDTLTNIKNKTDNIPTDPAKESGKLTSLETILTAIRDTAGVKKITDPLPAGTNNIGDVDVLSSALPTGAATEATLLAADGRLTTIDSVLDSIKDTDGIKKITDPVAVTDNSGSLTVDTPQLPSALDGDGNLKVAVQQTGTTATKVEGRFAAGVNTPNPVGIGGMDSTTLRAVTVDSQGRIITAPTGSSSTTKGFRDGKTSTTDPVTVPIRDTTYTEQTSGAQRSVASASASDTSAGTGARTVRLTYYTATLAGPYTEDLTLNGTTGVNTVATDICFIEKIEVLTVGSGGTNAGIISIYTAINKGGSVFGSIALGVGRTQWAHHYVANGQTCFITGLRAGMSGGGTTAGGVFVRRAKPTIANTYEVQISDFVRMAMPGYQGTVPITYATPLEVVGPARVTMYATEDGTNDLVWYGSFDFYEQAS